jgi:type VI secretion system protein ImpA
MLSNSELLAPIPGESPAGAYLRYEPLYDQIKEARRADEEVSQGEWQTARKASDWSLVVRLTTDALTRKSKDLQLAAWLTEALLHRDGFSGLRAGLAVLPDMLRQFWDHIYPPVDDGDLELRAGPLDWIGMRLDVPVRLAPLTAAGFSFADYRGSRSVPTKEEAEDNDAKKETRDQAVNEGKITPEEFEAAFAATPKSWYKAVVADIDASLATIAQLSQLCEEKFAGAAPSFIALRTVLQEVRQIAGQLLARKLELEPDPVETVPIGEAASSVLSAGGASAGGLPAGGPRTADEAGAWIAAAAQRLRQERPTDPASYLMLRGYRWGELRANGERINPKLLAAPSTEIRVRLKGLLLDGRYPELLEAAEQVMAQPYGRGWLDLQRYALSACDALGAEYGSVCHALRSALRALLADLPELPSLTLMDDNPTANAETLNWLRQSNLLPGDAPTVEADAELSAPRPSFGRRDVFEVAQERARSGDTRGAVDLLMREAVRERSARARFQRRAQAASIMVDAGMEIVALPILKELVEQIENHRLEDWEAGDAVAEPLALLFLCLTKLDSNEVDRDDLYVRICRLDPVRGVQLADGRGINA